MAHSSTLGYVDANIATKNVVSNLLYGVNIDYFVCLHEEGIKTLANIIGDVNIVLNETIPDKGFVEGDIINVNKDNIEKFITTREVTKVGGAEKRLERITDYIIASYNKYTNCKDILNILKKIFSIKEKNTVNLSENIYDQLLKYITTDIKKPTSLIVKYLGYNFSEQNVFYIPHTTGLDENGVYEVCYIKEKETKEILVNIFYDQVLY